jgi:hypothetical protein
MGASWGLIRMSVTDHTGGSSFHGGGKDAP